MFLNIITPCSRPENLLTISKSINIPKENYRWIVVCDSQILPHELITPNNCEVHLHVNSASVVGHSQRNFALNLIEDGHVYFNDDDTIIHKNLWENIKDSNNDFISFSQDLPDGRLRLRGDKIKVGKVDSHSFIVDRNLIGETRFNIREYSADGMFASECYTNSKTPLHINKVLSTYNSLR
jgi:hypothetical protein